MTDIATKEPLEILAGDTLQWKKALPDYPASSGFTLKYRLINAAGKIDLVSTADGDDHLISVSATLSAAYPAGTYMWISFVEKGSPADPEADPPVQDTLERHTIAQGTIDVKPSLAIQSGGLDIRSHAKKVLDALEAVIEGRASRSDLEYAIGDKRFSNMSHADLIKARSFYREEYRRELAAENVKLGKSSGGRILSRFR